MSHTNIIHELSNNMPMNILQIADTSSNLVKLYIKGYVPLLAVNDLTALDLYFCGSCTFRPALPILTLSSHVLSQTMIKPVAHARDSKTGLVQLPQHAKE